MKTPFIIAIFGLIFFACSTDTTRITVTIYPDGQVEHEQFFRIHNNDSILVKEIGYYTDGTKRIEGEYLDGKRNGRWTYWYEDGKKWSEANYQADVRHGKSTVWHENGRKYFEGNYKSGDRVGRWRFWDEDGTLMKDINYDK